MVLIHIKGKDPSEQFILECKTTDEIEDVSCRAVDVWNLRLRIREVAESCKAMANFGTLRPEEERGITDLKQFRETFPDSLTNPTLDSEGLRMGNPPPKSAAENLVRTAEDALNSISESHAIGRRALDIAGVESHLKLLSGAITCCYPDGLPKWDLTHQLLEGEFDPINWESGNPYDRSKAQLWFAGKKLVRGETLRKYVGKNEKTKIIVKIQRSEGKGAPTQESAIDENTRKKMMAFWHRKQETKKELEEDDDDSYLTSSWADPKSMKKSFTNTSNLRFT